MMLTNWSYSRYGAWKKCPALLKFQMEDTTPRESHPAAARGTEIHKTIENYLLGSIPELPENLAYYTGFLDTLRKNGAIPELPMALDKSWKKVAWDDPNRWWRGVLDCMITTPETIYIYDWKTGQEYADHREQREIYAAAVHSIADVPKIQVLHVYVDKKQNTTSNFTAKDIPALKQSWEDKIGEMFNDKTFAPNPGYYCRGCHFSRWNGGPCRF